MTGNTHQPRFIRRTAARQDTNSANSPEQEDVEAETGAIARDLYSGLARARFPSGAVNSAYLRRLLNLMVKVVAEEERRHGRHKSPRDCLFDTNLAEDGPDPPDRDALERYCGGESAGQILDSWASAGRPVITPQALHQRMRNVARDHFRRAIRRNLGPNPRSLRRAMEEVDRLIVELERTNRMLQTLHERRARTLAVLNEAINRIGIGS